uniref:Uncharacterized protein n=1 Tax=Cacopsylla melanoneura TaxID=428564 RepID=A0A8D8UN20_9HEMI
MTCLGPLSWSNSLLISSLILFLACKISPKIGLTSALSISFVTSLTSILVFNVSPPIFCTICSFTGMSVEVNWLFSSCSLTLLTASRSISSMKFLALSIVGSFASVLEGSIN